MKGTPFSNVRDAAQVLLAETGPLHYRELSDQLLERGLWETPGTTPWATVNSRISQDIKKRGTASRFVRTGKGVYGLREPDAPLPSAASHPRAPSPAPEPVADAEVPAARPTMSFTDAAEHVLDRHAGKQPMHYRDVTARVLADGLVQTEGKTPEATLYAQVTSEIKRMARRGAASRFVKHAPGVIGLRKWMSKGLAFQIERHNAGVRKKLLAHLRAMDPADFEAVVGLLLVALGFEEVTVTKVSADGGIDVRGVLVVGDAIETRMAVQVKRWKANVQRPIVQQVRGSLGAHDQGLIITTGGFSKGARDEAEAPNKIPVGLMDGEQLVKLMVENDIGVSRSPYEILDLAGLELGPDGG